MRSAAPRASRGPDARRVALERFARAVEACRRCPLGRQRTQAVVYRGGARPRLVFVGEAPGAEEDRVGLPFVGRSGQILDRAIATLGLPVGRVGILNVLKCRPPENKFDRAAADACRPHFERQLALLRPRALVSLGTSALRALDPGAPPMLVAAGTPRATAFGPLFPLIHPAASLRSGAMRTRWTTDVARLAGWVASAGV